jgi:hypothetical protein
MNMGRWMAVMAVVSLAGCESFDQGIEALTGPRFQRMPDTTSAWENPNKPWEQWGNDRAECRAVASDQAEREYALDRAASPPLDYSRTVEYQRAVGTFEAQRFEETLFERCMTNRGYRRVPRANGDTPEPRE